LGSTHSDSIALAVDLPVRLVGRDFQLLLLNGTLTDPVSRELLELISSTEFLWEALGQPPTETMTKREQNRAVGRLLRERLLVDTTGMPLDGSAVIVIAPMPFQVNVV